jgi:hypothetical protein
MEGIATDGPQWRHVMATDAKLGLVVGLGVVLTVAVTYYPKTGPRRGAGTAVPARPTAARATSEPAPPAIPSERDAATRLDTP